MILSPRGYAHICVAVVLVMSASGCAVQRTVKFLTEDHITDGIFAEQGYKAALPQGMVLRPVYDKGILLTKDAEGFRPRLYNDIAQHCTIGYGHLVKRPPCDGTEPAEYRVGVSEPRGTEILLKDMENARLAVMDMVTAVLDDGQYAAMCDFVFNVGAEKFRSSTLLVVVNSEEFDRVPGQLSRWTLANGKKVSALQKRRDREIAMFMEGTGATKGVPIQGEDLSPIDVAIGESPPH